MTRQFQIIGAISAALAVIAGAFSAHVYHVSVIETGAQYEMYHALALLILGSLAPSRYLRAAGYLFIAGTVLFSGSLYAIGATGIAEFGFITPVGGVAFLLGWACFAVGIIRG